MTNDILKKYKYIGCIHIHSLHSDGTGNIEKISRDAKKAGLSWIIVTDHNYLDSNEGIYNGVYVLKGEEISPKTQNHYIALGINEQIEPDDNPQTYIDKVREQNGIGFAAHPDESVKRKNDNPPIIWDKTFTPDGVEIWNWFSNWADNLDSGNIFKLAYCFLCKHDIIKNPTSDTLEWWDNLNNNSAKIIPAIGGVDAHALKIRKYIIPVTVFPYKTCFKTITNVILLNEPLSENFDTAKQQILTAIKQGNNLVINRKVCDNIPDISILNADSIKSAGEAITLTDDTYLDIKTEKITDIKVIKDCEEYANSKGKKLRIPITQSGKYRVELSYSGRGYAYTNPIKVTED